MRREASNLLELDENRLGRDELTLSTVHRFHPGVCWRAQGKLHLHCLEDDQRITALDLCTRLDEYLDDSGRHGGGERLGCAPRVVVQRGEFLVLTKRRPVIARDSVKDVPIPEGPRSIGATSDEDHLQATIVLDQVRAVPHVGYHKGWRGHERHQDNRCHGSQLAFVRPASLAPRAVACLTAA